VELSTYGNNRPSKIVDDAGGLDLLGILRLD